MIIRDAVHGSIETTDLEERIIDSAQFQRLRFVRQLSTAHLVYPSAAHSRFEHSLGTMHLTGMAARQLELEDEEVGLLRLAGLLHDIGHSAFSHLGDEVLVEHGRPGHEKRGIDLVKNEPLGAVIESAGFSLKELVTRLEGKGTGALITQNLGTDRLDYLLRDSHHTGVGYSSVDYERLLHTLVLSDGAVRVHEKGLVAAESLLVSRQFMFATVYHHPVAMISSAMLARALQQGLEGKIISPEELEQGTDLEVLAKLRDAGIDLAKRIWERRLYKKAVMLRVQQAPAAVREFLNTQDCQAKLAEHLESIGIATNSFVICPPPKAKSVREVEVVLRDGTVHRLEELSPLLRALDQPSGYRSLIVACEPSMVEKTAKAVNNCLTSIGRVS